MATLKIKATFQCDIEKLWQVITSIENYQWRSDLRSIEVINDHKFIEHTKDSFSIIFTVTAKVPYQRWEFDMEMTISKVIGLVFLLLIMASLKSTLLKL